MNDKNFEIIDHETPENMPQEQSTLPATQEFAGMTPQYLKQLDFIANNIEKYVETQDKIWRAILKISKPGDWVIFGQGEKESVSMTGPCAERIASRLGVSFTNWLERKELIEDAKGLGYRYWFECDSAFGGRTVRAIGRASSRDKFFGVKQGQLRPIEDIPEDNIRMAAFRGAMKEGVRLLFGLRNIPKEEFEKAGISLLNTSKIDFKGSAPQQNNMSSNGSPEPQETNPGLISEAQRKRLYAIAMGAGFKQEEFKEALAANWKINSSTEVPWRQYDDVCKWFENNKKGGK